MHQLNIKEALNRLEMCSDMASKVIHLRVTSSFKKVEQNKKNCFDVTKRINIIQESHFIYDRSSLVKRVFTFILLCKVFNEKKNEKNTKITSASNQKSFTVEKNHGQKQALAPNS